METQTFQGIGKSALLAIRDDEMKEVLFAPGYKDYLKIGGMVCFAFLFFAFYMDVNRKESFDNNSGSLFAHCTSNEYDSMRIGTLNRKLCDEVLSDAKANGITTREEYVKLEMERASGNAPFQLIEIVWGLGAASAIFAVAIAALKKTDPFFMTAVGQSLEIESSGNTLNAFKISGKSVKKGVLNRNGLMTRKFANGYCIVSFYSTDKTGESMSSAERVVFEMKDAERMAERLDGFSNLRVSKTENNEILVSFK